MNFYSLTQLISGIFAVFLGAFVLSQNPSNKTYRYYALFCFSLSSWCICYFMWQIQSSKENALLWLRILMAFMSYIHSFFLHFVLSVTDSHKKKLITFSYILSTIFFFLFLSGIGFSYSLTTKMSIKFWPNGNLFTLSFILVQISLICFSLHCLYHAIQHSSGNKKNQLKYLLLISMPAWSAGLTNWFLWFNIPIPPIGNPLVTLYLAGMAYAILRHQLLDITVAIKKSLIYSVSATLLTILYFLFIFILEKLFKGLTGYRSNLTSALILIFFVLLFQPIKNYIQKIIDKYFFHGSIDQIDEENVKLREELQKSEKLKAVSTLAAGMAHEIKNPLTAIKTFTEYMPEKGADPEFRKKFQDVVSGEVDRINYIVKELLEFSKPSDLKLKDTQINALLDKTIALLNNDLLKHNIKVGRNYADIPEMKVDPAQMKQVFLNLFLNAIEAMPDGGTLTITTETHPLPYGERDRVRGNTTNANNAINTSVIIRITDTGKGIPKEDLDLIFDPFFTKKDSGTGLGLSVAHGIIEKHGGKISAKSEPGNGTTFAIEL